MVLPLRETALVAKQAAAVDVLSGGRLRLGVAVGLNDVEYDAMGKTFHDRGARMEEQIEVLRLLWTRELVTFEGRWHKITDAGINPLPVRRPIPLWIGGGADPVVRRIGRLADGWMLPGTMRRPEDAAPPSTRCGTTPGGRAATPTRSACSGSSPAMARRSGQTRSASGGRSELPTSRSARADRRRTRSSRQLRQFREIVSEVGA